MVEVVRCPGCGTQLGPNLLACPGCQRLVYGDRLRALADEAGRASNPTDALIAWRSALELLPATTRQHATVSAKIADLGRLADQTGGAATPAATVDPAKGQGWAGLAGIGTLALIGWKAKTILLLVLTKGKLLLLGLGKLSTMSSMLLSAGVYATAFGWPLALGLVVSIYIHEMGHVAALLRYGVKASAPLFIPGVGAVIRLRQALGDPRQDARVGLAGPLWGTVAAGVAALLWVGTGQPIWAGIAKLGASINLFNLLPFASLDGGRAFHALNRSQRWFAVLALSVCWTLAHDPIAEGILILLMIVGVIAALGMRPSKAADRGALIAYVALAGVLTYLADIQVPLPRDPAAP